MESGESESGTTGGMSFEVSGRDTSQIFSVPEWLRNAGLMSWLLIGVAFLLGGLVWLIGPTAIIVVTVITASIVAAVASPVIAWLQRHRVPRALGAILMMLAIIGVTVGMLVVVAGSGASNSVKALLHGHSTESKALHRSSYSWR